MIELAKLKRLTEWITDIESVVSLIGLHRELQHQFDTCSIDRQAFLADRLATSRQWIGHFMIKLTTSVVD
jgi:hypothetical protein